MILVALVAGDDDDGPEDGDAKASQKIRRAHHIGRIGLYRINIRTPHQRLGGQVEYYFRR